MKSSTHNRDQDSIIEHARTEDWIAIKEHYLNGKKIDVLLQNKRTRHTIAAEVQVTYNHGVENIILDLMAGCDEVWIISTNKKVSDRIERRAHRELDINILGKARFLVINEFIPNLKQQQIGHKAELMRK